MSGFGRERNGSFSAQERTVRFRKGRSNNGLLNVAIWWKAKIRQLTSL